MPLELMDDEAILEPSIGAVVESIKEMKSVMMIGDFILLCQPGTVCYTRMFII
jgi:hypothetical protein